MSLKNTVFLAGIAFSATTLADMTDIKNADNQVSVQFISTQIDYTETGNNLYGVNGVTLDTENGHIQGGSILVSTMKDWLLGNDYLEAEYSHADGFTNYVGGLYYSNNGSYGSYTRQNSATLADYHLRYGKGFSLNNRVMLTPYAELGHHDWNRGINNGIDYTHQYYGAGLLGQYSPFPKLVLNAGAFAGKTYRATLAVSTIPGVLTGFSTGLGSSDLYQTSLGADYAFTAHIHGNLGIEHTQFKYDATVPEASCGGCGETPSASVYTTLKIGLGYAF